MKSSVVGLFLSFVSMGDLVRARYLRSDPPRDGDHLTVDRQAMLSHCSDTTGTFSIPGNEDSFDCSWLRANIRQADFLCDRLEISSTCRVTCGVCEDTIKAVELVKDCKNHEGRVELSRNSNVWTDCASLQSRDAVFQAQACSTTAVALFCPIVCDTFHFGEGSIIYNALPSE